MSRIIQTATGALRWVPDVPPGKSYAGQCLHQWSKGRPTKDCPLCGAFMRIGEDGKCESFVLPDPERKARGG